MHNISAVVYGLSRWQYRIHYALVVPTRVATILPLRIKGLSRAR